MRNDVTKIDKISMQNVNGVSQLLDSSSSIIIPSSVMAIQHKPKALPSVDLKTTDCKREQKLLKMIELKCLEMKELMLTQGLESEYVSLRICIFEQMLLKKEGLQTSRLHFSTVSNNINGDSNLDAVKCEIMKKKMKRKEKSVSNNATQRSRSRSKSTREQRQKSVTPDHHHSPSALVNKTTGLSPVLSTFSNKSKSSKKSNTSSRKEGKKPSRRSYSRSTSPKCSRSRSRSRSSAYAARRRRSRSSSGSHWSSHSASRSRSRSVRRRRGSPSHLDRRRITRPKSPSARRGERRSSRNSRETANRQREGAVAPSSRR